MRLHYAVFISLLYVPVLVMAQEQLGSIIIGHSLDLPLTGMEAK
jgi:hypothetical protein